MFFNYAVQYVADHPDVTADIEITDDIVEEFRQFLKEKEFDYKTDLQVAYESLLEAVEEDG